MIRVGECIEEVWIEIVGALEKHGEDLSLVDQAYRDYEPDRIDEQELNHRLAFHLDDRNEEVREVVSQVTNVDEEISKDIARELESLDDLRRADGEGLTAVHGVAESTADAVLASVRE